MRGIRFKVDVELGVIFPENVVEKEEVNDEEQGLQDRALRHACSNGTTRRGERF